MRLATHSLLALITLALAGCAVGDRPLPDAGSTDAGSLPEDSGPLFPRDAGPVDAGSTLDAGLDAGASDGGLDVDAGPQSDAGADAGAADAGPDAGPVGCAAIHPGDTLALDGVNDLVRYSDEQQFDPGAPFEAGDRMGITWDQDFLYVTLVSNVFLDESRPLHLYLEGAARTLPAASPGVGKEYGGFTAALPFTGTHLIALRRTSSIGGQEYNGVYLPGAAWATRARPLTLGADYWVQADDGAISVRVAWLDLGCPNAIRLSAHVVNGVVDNEWKDLVPEGAQPWGPADGPGAYYEIDLRADPDIAGWTLR